MYTKVTVYILQHSVQVNEPRSGGAIRHSHRELNTNRHSCRSCQPYQQVGCRFLSFFLLFPNLALSALVAGPMFIMWCCCCCCWRSSAHAYTRYIANRSGQCAARNSYVLYSLQRCCINVSSHRMY